jgi:plastocyanin
LALPTETHNPFMTRMRALTVLLAAVGVLIAAPSYGATPNAPSVQIARGTFTPSSVTIKAGGSITILNSDSVDHTITSPAAKIPPTLLHPTDNVAQAFPTPGTYVITDAQNPNLRLTVVVEEAGATVSLSIAPKAVQAGRSATLRGSLSTGAAGQQVRVEAQSCGASTFTGVKTLTTGNGGSFSLAVRPRSNTTYRVRFGDGTATVGAQVSPLLRLRKTGARSYVVTVAGAKAKVIAVQTRPPGKGWRPTGRSRVTGGVARFTLQAAPGTRVRASVDSAAAGGCLGTGISNVVSA